MSIFGDLEIPPPRLSELSVRLFSAVVPKGEQDVHLHAEAKATFSGATTGTGAHVGFFVNGRNIKEIDTDKYGLALIDESFPRRHFKDIQNTLVVRVPGFAGEAAESFDLQLPAPEPAPLPAREPNPEEFDWPNAPEAMDNSIGMKFVLIRPGRFKMGQHHGDTLVRIETPFYMAIYPVTQSEFQRLMGYNPSWFTTSGQGSCNVKGILLEDEEVDLDEAPGPGFGSVIGGPEFPVEEVDWDEAQEFCRLLSRLPEELESGCEYRLPSQQEWEYACRAGTTTNFSFGNDLSIKQANCYASSGTWGEGAQKGPRRTTKVGSYPANPWGLCDMHGNVHELCSDGTMRGGNWSIVAELCAAGVTIGGSVWGSWCHARSAVSTSTIRGNGRVGFRIVRIPASSTEH